MLSVYQTPICQDLSLLSSKDNGKWYLFCSLTHSSGTRPQMRAPGHQNRVTRGLLRTVSWRRVALVWSCFHGRCFRLMKKGGIGVHVFSSSVRYWFCPVFIVGGPISLRRAVLVLLCFHRRWSHLVEKGGLGFAVFSSSVLPFRGEGRHWF